MNPSLLGVVIVVVPSIALFIVFACLARRNRRLEQLAARDAEGAPTESHETSQAHWVDVAKGGGLPDARFAAVDKISDQDALLDVARNGESGYTISSRVRLRAAGKVRDRSLVQDVYADIVWTDWDELGVSEWEIVTEAFRHLNDPMALAKIAKGDARHFVFVGEYWRSTGDQSATSFTVITKRTDLRTEALHRIDDGKLLADIAHNAQESEVAEQAIRKLSDVELLEALARDATRPEVKVWAKDRLNSLRHARD
ncbi:MAG: hypothetical protein LBK95_12025 [Bifidobacteriaceae bacterium]|jgi:hypothetical protein|nr:hypothetical protein [Bifidobacteriaceae bacterium]